MRPSLRMQAVQLPIIPVVGELIRRHPGTISLGQGVAYWQPPQEALEQIQAFLADPENHKYQLVQGIPPLLRAIEAKLAGENGIAVGPDSRVVVTAGGNMAFLNAVLAVADAGDEVIQLSPYYFNHEMAVVIAGARPVIVPTDERYQVVVEAIEAAVTASTRAVVTISPNNPSGAVYGEAALRRVNDLCRRRGLYHISDEAYEYFTYGGARHFSPGCIAAAGGHTISLFSLSKAYGLASWRIGYMVVPEHLYLAVRKIQDTNLICPPVISQYAAIGAMQRGAGYCRDKLGTLIEIRRLILAALAELGDLVTPGPADGAFYVLLKVHADLDAMDLVEQLIRRHGVAVIPGTTFGLHDGCYLRVAYGALDKAAAAEGIGRLCRGLRAILGG